MANQHIGMIGCPPASRHARAFFFQKKSQTQFFSKKITNTSLKMNQLYISYFLLSIHFCMGQFCSVGQWCDDSGACAMCPTGHACSNASLICSSHQAGNVSTSRSTGSVPCAAGNFAGLVGLSQCTLCSAGKFVDSPGMSSCGAVPVGSYAPIAGVRYVQFGRFFVFDHYYLVFN
jgi:hypothetical protein